MQKTVSFTTALLFFIWILPLGVFIKPSQEKKACNGQRAICLCTHLLAKAKAKWAGKILLRNATNTDKETSGPGGASHDYLASKKDNKINKQFTFFHHQQSTLYALLFIRPIEHIPKAPGFGGHVPNPGNCVRVPGISQNLIDKIGPNSHKMSGKNRIIYI